MSERRSSTICAVVERPDHHCGDDVVYASHLCPNAFNTWPPIRDTSEVKGSNSARGTIRPTNRDWHGSCSSFGAGESKNGDGEEIGNAVVKFGLLESRRRTTL